MFKVALAQTAHPVDGDVIKMVASHCEKAASQGAKLIVFPESLMTRYEEEHHAFQKAAEALDGAFCTAMNRLARRYGVWIIYTVNELNPQSEKPFNTAVLVDDAGAVKSVYRKVHLFDSATTTESERMSKGEKLSAVVEAPFGRLGIGICYDLRFPEFARRLALQGADILIYPAAWVSGENKVLQWKTLLAARAVENCAYAIGISRCDEGYCGNSAVFSPQGVEVASCANDEELLICEIDLSENKRAREAIPVLSNRRDDLY